MTTDTLALDARLTKMLEASDEALFERFDQLHKRDIHDDDVIHSLRRLNEPDLAERYIEWSGALDPDRDDNTTTSPYGVTDPGNSPSYDTLTGIRTTGTVSFGGPAIEFGRDGKGTQYVRPIGGVWVAVVEK